MSYDIESVAGRYGLLVGRTNDRVVVVLCVFHQERTPSLVIWRQSQRFLCHGCRRQGTVRELIEFLDSDVPPPEAFVIPGPDQLEIPFDTESGIS